MSAQRVAHYVAYPEGARARSAAYYVAHREERCVYARVHRAEHQDELRTYHRAYRAAHRSDLQAKDCAYYVAHREEVKGKAAAYRQAHPEEKRARDAASYMAHRETRGGSGLRWRYNLTAEAYDALLAAQGGVCAICGQCETATRLGRVLPLSVDHDHACCPSSRSCGRCVRGLLCRSCNHGEQRRRDNMRAIA